MADMQDLINEEEFIKVRHDPWRQLKRYYAFAALQSVLFVLSFVLGLHFFAVKVFWCLYVILPAVTIFFFFLSDKRNIALTRPVKLRLIIRFMMTYVVICGVGFLLFRLYRFGLRRHETLLFGMIGFLVISLVQFGASTFVIFVLSSFRTRREY